MVPIVEVLKVPIATHIANPPPIPHFIRLMRAKNRNRYLPLPPESHLAKELPCRALVIGDHRNITPHRAKPTLIDRQRTASSGSSRGTASSPSSPHPCSPPIPKLGRRRRCIKQWLNGRSHLLPSHSTVPLDVVNILRLACILLGVEIPTPNHVTLVIFFGYPLVDAIFSVATTIYCVPTDSSRAALLPCT